jgi:multidrug resistance efflux pump
VLGGVIGVGALLALILPRGEAATRAAKPEPASKAGSFGISFGGAAGARRVEVTRPRRGDVAATCEAPGTVRAGSEVGLGAPFEGRVVDLVKDEGDPVEAGDVLFRLDPTEHEEKVREGELTLERQRAALLEAKAELAEAERKAGEADKEPSELTEARLRLRQAELEAQRARAQLEAAQTKLTRAEQMQATGIGTKIDVESAKDDVRVSGITTRIAEEQLGLAGETLSFRERTWQTTRAEAGKNLAIAQARHERAKGDVGTSELTLEKARRDLERCDVKTPLAGVVTSRGVNLGDLVSRVTRDAVHYIVSDLERLVVYSDVDEGDVVKVAQGQRARASVNALGISGQLAGRVYDVGYRGQKASGQEVTTFLVRVLLDSPQEGLARLRPGMTTSVEIETERAEGVLVVPLQAVVQREVKELPEPLRAAPELRGKQPQDLVDVVFVAADGKASARLLQGGVRDADEVEVRGGLDEQAQVIVGPFRTLEKLQDGDTVRPEEAELPGGPSATSAATSSATVESGR